MCCENVVVLKLFVLVFISRFLPVGVWSRLVGAAHVITFLSLREKKKAKLIQYIRNVLLKMSLSLIS